MSLKKWNEIWIKRVKWIVAPVTVAALKEAH